MINSHNIEFMNDKISSNVDPIKILVKKILETDSTLIMNEATKAIRILSKSEIVIEILYKEDALISIVKEKLT